MAARNSAGVSSSVGKANHVSTSAAAWLQDRRPELIRIYEKAGPLTTGEVERVCKIIRAAGGFTRARDQAVRYVRLAQKALREIPPSPAVRTLVADKLKTSASPKPPTATPARVDPNAWAASKNSRTP